MVDVVRNSTQYMNDEDLEAVALYWSRRARRACT